MHHKRINFYLTIFGGLAICLTGCSQQTLNSAQKDAQNNVAVVNREGQRAVKNSKPQIDKFGLETRVTTALVAANLNTVHVRADAGGVYLRGTVNSTEDKSRAGQIARDTLGPGKIVHNQLQVNGE